MSIEYNVVPNSLTMPPSFSCRVQPKQVLDFQDVAEQINLHNPTIPVVTAKSVLEAFREEVMIQLLAGNTVKLTNFCSFVTTMPGRLVNATDPIPQNMVNVTAKMAAPFKTEMDEQASYTRIGYPTKDPSITQAADTNTGLIAFIESGKGFRIDGKNLGFNVNDAQLGVYLLDYQDVETKQTNISINDPSKIVITPSFVKHDDSFSEIKLVMRNRYTTNGTIRTGTYAKKLRSTVDIANANANLIFCINDVTSTTEITGWTDGPMRIVMQLYLDTDNVLCVRARTISGDFGIVTQIAAAGAHVVNIGALYQMEITVGTYQTLYDNCVAYGRFIQEVCDMTTLT